ncbi:hypothetical protein CsSME_00006548 [Camellia sinensis var. sinensis]
MQNLSKEYKSKISCIMIGAQRFGIIASDIFNQERPGSREDSSFTSGLEEASDSRGYLSTYRDVAPVAALGGLITVGAFHNVVE